MARPTRIARLIEHWMLPEPEQILDHVRRAQIEVVQAGNYGSEFYALAEDPDIEPFWAGMPLPGIRANLERAAEIIPQIQRAGARVVGQLSTTMLFGQHEQALGIFGPGWSVMWSAEVLGAAPCDSPEAIVQRRADGALDWRTIDGRPYRTYRGCMTNPQWRSALKAMVAKGLALGLDGFNATHHYESLCHCVHCRTYLQQFLEQHLSKEQLLRFYGTADLTQVDDLQTAQAEPERLDLLVAQASGQCRKECFDEVFIDYGRTQRPDLLLAQWNHKYDFRPHDERSLLPAPLWAQGEDYIWYSQGPHKWGSAIGQGYLADMGLPARFMYAAGGGRPFVINKYDYRRWRVWAGEAMAHHGTALAFHAGPPRLEQETSTNVAPEDYYGPVIRYQRFMAQHEALLHPAVPWSQIGLVYPRRAELQAEMACLDALKRLGHLLEDGHWLFDIILDEQLLDKGGAYAVLILPEITRLSNSEAAFLEDFVARGGQLIFTGGTGQLDEMGKSRAQPLFAQWRNSAAAPGTWYIADGPWTPEKTMLHGTINAEMPIYPKLADDPFGEQFLAELDAFAGPAWLRTNAPWHVRVRAWRPESEDALVIHWINYLQDEEAAIELPIPIGPIEVACQLPSGFELAGVEWRYPEMRQSQKLEFSRDDDWVRFAIPRLIAYGMSVLPLRPT